MRRHIIIIAVAVGVLVGITLAVVALTTPVRRFPVGALALGPDEALIATRYNDHKDSRFFWELVSPRGGWSDDTTPIRASEALGFSGAAASRDGATLFVMGVDRADTVWVGALARADGQPRWWTSLPGTAGRKGGGRLGPMLLVDAQRVYAIHEVPAGVGRTSERLDALDAADGRLAWSFDGASVNVPPPVPSQAQPAVPTPLAPTTLDVRLAGTELLLGHGRGVDVLDPATGRALRRLPLSSVLCVSPSGDGVVGLDGETPVWLPLAPGAAPVRFAVSDAGFSWTNTCGFRGDDVVLNLQRTAGWFLLRVARATGRIVSEVSLGPGVIATDPILLTPALPRFVPFSLCGTEGTVPFCNLVVADLDQPRVTLRQRVYRSGTIAPLMDDTHTWLWMQSVASLVAIDPATGTLGAATGLVGFEARDVRADDVAARHLWVVGAENDHPGDLPWAVFDLTTGAIVATHGDVETDDARARVDAALVAK